MNRIVQFSFASAEDKGEFEVIAKRRGLTLSQFVRWCVYKYKRDRDANTAGNRSRRAAEGRTHDLSE